MAILFFSIFAAITLLSFDWSDGAGGGGGLNFPIISSVISSLLPHFWARKSANRAFLAGASLMTLLFFVGFLCGKKVKSSSEKKPFSSYSTYGIWISLFILDLTDTARDFVDLALFRDFGEAPGLCFAAFGDAFDIIGIRSMGSSRLLSLIFPTIRLEHLCLRRFIGYEVIKLSFFVVFIAVFIAGLLMCLIRVLYIVRFDFMMLNLSAYVLPLVKDMLFVDLFKCLTSSSFGV